MRAAILRDRKITVENVPALKPAAGQVLVRTLVCGICGTDLNLYHNGQRMVDFSKSCGHPNPIDLKKGVIMGHEYCAEVIEYGKNTNKRIPVGATVCARPQLSGTERVDYIGFSSDICGGFAEYLLLEENELLLVPNGLPAETACLTEPLAVAEHAVNLSGLQLGDCPLVVGCGPIGLAIIALLRQRGVEPIVASEPDETRRKLALLLGADEVIDPQSQSLVEQWVQTCLSNGTSKKNTPPWLLFNCVGKTGMLQQIINQVPRRTRIVQVGINVHLDHMQTMMACPKEISIQFASGYSKEEFADCLASLAEGKVEIEPMVTSTVSLAELDGVMSEYENTHSQGKILVNPHK